MTAPRRNEPSYDEILEHLGRFGQKHLLRHWNELNAERRRTLAGEIAECDFALLADLFRGKGVWDPAVLPLQELEPPDVWTAGEEGPGITHAQAEAEGRRLLGSGRVACLIVAGGQGTRLGWDGPKGTFPIGPVSGKTLFAVHAAKVRAIEKKFGNGKSVPLIVMTSDVNDAETRRYFELHEDFGLAEVRFMKQSVLPAVDFDGKLFLSAEDTIFRSPAGHGGAIGALHRSGILTELEERGFTTLFYLQVDNPLVKVCEPFFLGAHRLSESEYSLKVLRKRDPGEGLGVLARHGERHLMVEYSDLPDELKRERDATGGLKFWAGSPAIHIFDLGFLKRLAGGDCPLPYHRAEKKVPHLNARGETVEPTEPNGIKFETFIFDALTYAQRVLAVEGIREEEFAPVKNASGEDSVESARRLIVDLHWKWLESRGVEAPRETDGTPTEPCEIHPSFALAPEDLPGDVADRVREDGPVYLE